MTLCPKRGFSPQPFVILISDKLYSSDIKSIHLSTYWYVQILLLLRPFPWRAVGQTLEVLCLKTALAPGHPKEHFICFQQQPRAIHAMLLVGRTVLRRGAAAALSTAGLCLLPWSWGSSGPEGGHRGSAVLCVPS